MHTHPPPVRVPGPVSIARLHGEACIVCGTVTSNLTPCGHITVADEDQIWLVVACVEHQPSTKEGP